MMRLGLGLGLTRGTGGGGAFLTAANFGDKTLEGAGGVATSGTSISSGDASSHWQIIGGFVVPTAAGETAGLNLGPYSLVFDDASTLTITIIANKFSARSTAELSAAWAATTTATDTGILVRDVDDQSAARASLGVKAFTNVFTIEPHVWTELADPRATVRGVKLPGITLASGCEKVTIQGINFKDDNVADAATSVIVVNTPSEDILVRQCEVHSSPLATEHSSGRMAAGTMTTIEGIECAGVGQHTRIRFNENNVHDVFRGITMLHVTDSASGPSEVNDNYFEDCYQFFTLAGEVTTTIAAPGLAIYDNTGMHVWSTTADAGAPHASVGLSMDPEQDGTEVMGNFFHMGYNRKVLEPSFSHGITGMKFNNPTLTDSYKNITCAFNTLVTHGLTIEVAGGDGIDIFNNALFSETFNGGGIASVSFEGAANVRIWNNLAENYRIGIYDGIGEKGTPPPVFVTTLDTLIGNGNQLFGAPSDNNGVENTARITGDVDPTPITDLTIDNMVARYTPTAGTFPLTAPQKRGALGTGLYSGGGVHTVTYDPPAASSGTQDVVPFTTWDGANDAASRGVLQDSGSDVVPGKVLTFAFEGSFDAAVDGASSYIFSTTGLNIAIWKHTTDKLKIRLETSGGTVIGEAQSSFTLDNATHYLSIAVDLADYRLLIAKDGVLDPYVELTETLVDDSFNWAATSVRIGSDPIGNPGANKFNGTLGKLYVTNEFLDLETDAGLNALYTATGEFVDFAADGSNVTGTAALVMYEGNAATLNAGYNGGQGGSFTMSGAVVDAAGVETATFTSSDWIAFTSDFSGNQTEGVYAFRITNKFTEGGAGDTHIVNSGNGLGDSLVRIREDDSDKLAGKIEAGSGSLIMSIPSVGADWAIDEVRSIFLRVKTGDTELIVDGVSLATSATAFTTLKSLEFLNSSDNAGTGAVAMQLAGFFASHAAGCADGTTGLVYGDFFDGSDLPIDAAFSGSDVSGFTPDVALDTVASINAYGGTTGTVT